MTTTSKAESSGKTTRCPAANAAPGEARAAPVSRRLDHKLPSPPLPPIPMASRGLALHRVNHIRAQIAKGTYETAAKIEALLPRLAPDLGLRSAQALRQRAGIS